MSELQGRPTFGQRNESVAAPQADNSNSEGSFDRVEAGAIWQKTSKAGRTFLSMSLKLEELKSIVDEAASGNRETVNLVAFINNKGGKESRPDYRIFRDKGNQ